MVAVFVIMAQSICTAAGSVEMHKRSVRVYIMIKQAHFICMTAKSAIIKRAIAMAERITTAFFICMAAELPAIRQNLAAD